MTSYPPDSQPEYPQYGQGGQPGYGQGYPPGYSQPDYRSGYGQDPSAFGPAGAGQQYPGQPPYGGYGSPYSQGYPPPPPGAYPQRPGTVTAAAVLGFVVAAAVILTGFFLFAGASAFNDVFNDGYYYYEYYGPGTGELVVDGILNLIAGGLLIAGGVGLLGRSPANALRLYVAGSALVIAESIYWVVRIASNTYGSVGGVVLFALLYATPVVVGVCLLLGTTAKGWLQRSGVR